MKPVGRAVDRLLRGLGIATDVARTTALDAWPAVAVSVLGSDAGATRAVAIEETTLVVSVPTPAWAAEIRLRENEVIRALDGAAPTSGIRRIRTVPGRT